MLTKTVLVITLGYPHPRHGASTVLFYWYLDALRRSGFRIEHLLLLSPDEVSDQAEREYIETIKPGPMFSVRAFAVPKVREARRSGLVLRGSELPSEVSDYVESVCPDAAVSFDIMAADLARRLRLDLQLIWLGDLLFQTGLYHAYYDFRAKPRRVFGLFRAFLASLLWKRFYRRTLRGQRHVIVSSYSSVARLARLGVKSRYWPYPWPAACTHSSRTAAKYNKPTFIMFGTLAALGSRSALDFLLKSVYPRLLKAWGSEGFSILITGAREPPPWVLAHIRSRPEFKFLGFVDDLGAEVRRCHAVLAPVSVPVGNRSRIVTAMSMGALVIAHVNTRQGNPDLVSGENCLLTSSADEFADHMQLAYQDPSFSESLGAAAQRTYLGSFEPEIASRRLVLELDSMLTQP